MHRQAHLSDNHINIFLEIVLITISMSTSTYTKNSYFRIDKMGTLTDVFI